MKGGIGEQMVREQGEQYRRHRREHPQSNGQRTANASNTQVGKQLIEVNCKKNRAPLA